MGTTYLSAGHIESEAAGWKSGRLHCSLPRSDKSSSRSRLCWLRNNIYFPSAALRGNIPLKIGPSQTFPTLQRGSYGSVLKEKMPGKSVCWRSCLRPSSITQVPDHKKIQVSLKRGLYIVRRSINLITRNAYSYASTPVTIIPTLTWCPQCEP